MVTQLMHAIILEILSGNAVTWKMVFLLEISYEKSLDDLTEFGYSENREIINANF